jgi:succinate dehydrogenase assembly factor 1
MLTCVRLKPPPSRPALHKYIGDQFRLNATKVTPKDITAVEFLLRKGRRSLEMLEDPHTQGVSVPMVDWRSPVFRTREERPAFARAPKPDSKEATKGGKDKGASSAGFPAPGMG